MEFKWTLTVSLISNKLIDSQCEFCMLLWAAVLCLSPILGFRMGNYTIQGSYSNCMFCQGHLLVWVHTRMSISAGFDCCRASAIHI